MQMINDFVTEFAEVLTPVATLGGKVGLEVFATHVQGNRLSSLCCFAQAFFLEYLGKQRYAYIDGVNAQDRGQLEDLHDFRWCGAGFESGGGVGADAGLEQRGTGGVYGEEDEFLDFGREFLLVDGDGAELEVGGEVGGVEGQDVFPGGGPGSTLGNEVRLQGLLVAI